MHPKIMSNAIPRKPYAFERSGNGAYFYLQNDRKTLDLSSQTVNLLFGHNHPKIINAVKSQLDQFLFADEDFSTRLNVEAINELYQNLPSYLNLINFRMNDASSAVECAIKLARRVTGKPKVLTCDGIYLGQNQQTINMRGWGKPRKDISIGSYEDVIFCPQPFSLESDHCSNLDFALSQIQNIIREHKNELACVILDPVMLSSGGFASEIMKQFICESNAMCLENNIIYILDESQSYGWVEDVTLTKHWGLNTDILILGKGVAGGLPLSVCAAKECFDGLIRGDADYTHGGHPLSMAALREVSKLIRETDESFRALVSSLKSHMDHLNEYRDVVVYGEGLIWGIKICKYNQHEENILHAQRVAKWLLDNGIYVRTYSNCLGIKPPRVIDINTLIYAINKTIEAVSINFNK